MTEPTTASAAPTGHGAEVTTYTRVAPSLVTVREGQGTWDRAGDKGEEVPAGDGPRAGAPRDARARGASLTRLLAITQRQGVVSDSQLVQDARDLAANGLTALAELWSYVLGETWMRGSDAWWLQWGGRLLAALVATPLVAIAHLLSMLAALLADVVELLFTRYARAGATLAVVALVVAVWPFGDDEPAPPPPAETEIVVQDGGTR